MKKLFMIAFLLFASVAWAAGIDPAYVIVDSKDKNELTEADMERNRLTAIRIENEIWKTSLRSGPVGRFQAISSPRVIGESVVFILDTKEGRVWVVPNKDYKAPFISLGQVEPYK
jgi:hypothetical protein